MTDKRFVLGDTSFERMRKRGAYFVDKTAYIRQIYEDGNYVTLITRPRRFGKTLTQSMLKNYTDMIDVIREMLSRGLKDSDYLEKAVVTGCLRIAKESVFTGLNHFGCHTISDDSLSDALGITPNEAQITDADCRTIRLYGIAFSGKTCYIVQEIQKPL